MSIASRSSSSRGCQTTAAGAAPSQSAPVGARVKTRSLSPGHRGYDLQAVEAAGRDHQERRDIRLRILHHSSRIL
jgi:hypothetical protein